MAAWVKVTELLPQDAPVPKGKHVVTLSYHDDNLHHKFVTVPLVTGVLHFLSENPVDWHSKKQAVVEIAVCGSENSSDRTCVDQILDLRIKLRHLGAPIWPLSCMLSENRSVVDSSITPHGNICKILIALSFYLVRESIASKIVTHQIIDGKCNPVDM